MVRKNFTITMNEKLMKESQEHSRKLGIPNSRFIEECIEKALKKTKEQRKLEVN